MRPRPGAKAGGVRYLLLLMALPLLATFALPSMQVERPPPAVTTVTFTPVPLNEQAPGQKRLGRLVFLQGWALTSNDPRFGGISGLHVDRREVLAVSDSGWVIGFTLREGGTVRGAVRPVRSGAPDRNKAGTDAESLVVRGREAWLGFEHANVVRRYRMPDWKLIGSAVPAAIAKWNENRGPEAMVRLADGRFLVFSEGSGGDSRVALFNGDPAAGAEGRGLRYRPPQGYRITDAAVLPDGRLLLLNRRARLFEGFSAKLSLAALPPLEEGALISGEVIADFTKPVTTDNLEGLGVAQEGGRTIVWIASDDNYNPLQRTLILKFALAF